MSCPISDHSPSCILGMSFGIGGLPDRTAIASSCLYVVCASAIFIFISSRAIKVSVISGGSFFLISLMMSRLIGAGNMSSGVFPRFCNSLLSNNLSASFFISPDMCW